MKIGGEGKTGEVKKKGIDFNITMYYLAIYEKDSTSKT